MVFLCTYVLYNAITYGYLNGTPFLNYITFFFSGALILLATYFLMNETKQLKDGGFEYLTSIWNYLDLLSPLGVYTLVAMTTYNEFFPL